MPVIHVTADASAAAFAAGKWVMRCGRVLYLAPSGHGEPLAPPGHDFVLPQDASRATCSDCQAPAAILAAAHWGDAEA